ncbi:MAG TPA: RNA polymerase subunit sigma-70 [Acidimicrobiales bacterium]
MTDLMTAPDAAPVGPPRTSPPLERRFEAHRGELRAHCRRMLGSASEADDAVQETFVRAWRSFDRFEGRSALSTWLHRIATNVCLDMRGAAQRRARPADPASWGTDSPAGRHPSPSDDDPAEQAVARESVRLALGAALLHLPPRQRSVLLLRDVLRWRATEVAELLGTTVASVNSALQRARTTLADAHRSADRSRPTDDGQQALLQRYVEAFEHYDVDALVALLRR